MCLPVRKEYHEMFQKPCMLLILSFVYLVEKENCIFAIFELTIPCNKDRINTEELSIWQN